MMSQQDPATACQQRSLREVLWLGVQRLSYAGIETARLDAEVILSHVLAMTREQLVISAELPLDGSQVQRFEENLLRRLAREPVAYITGRQEFWSLDFLVSPEVLIPRSDTECLVEKMLMLAAGLPRFAPKRILDMGTGSGAIAISLAKELSATKIWAVDCSAPALEIARANAARLGVAERIKFICGDLFEPVGEGHGQFALIVSNPPYIRSAEIPTLEPEVSRWEPRAALDGGADGLNFYRRIAAQAWLYLAPGGAIVVEIGAPVGVAVAKLFEITGHYASAEIFPDYAGRDRLMVATRFGAMAG
jgi:release factor glutamine methyltransferase